MPNSNQPIRQWLGIERNSTSHAEKIVSALGAGLGIAVVFFCSQYFIALELINAGDQILILASMGATAVLLFAVPHGALSQPWQVLAGHIISAAIGVSCQRMLPGMILSGALAVGLSVGVMYYLRCIHPPGGATALAFVIGSPALHTLGYQYIIFPILVNVLAILATAVIFNGFFYWRRYPAHFNTKKRLTTTPTPATNIRLTTEDFSAAMHDLDSFIDITEEGITELLERAQHHAALNAPHPSKIVAGRYYSNGKIGNEWSIRQVVDDANTQQPSSKDLVIYKVLAGHEAYETGICQREEFRQWAQFEVYENAGRWLKKRETS